MINIIVSDYYALIKNIIKTDNIEGYDCSKFIKCFIEDRHHLKEIGSIFIHLYYEYKGEVSNLRENIIQDPLKCPVSEIIGATIFNIVNENNKEHFIELLGKMKFISMNKAKYYSNCEYITNYKESFILLDFKSKTNLANGSDTSLSLSNEKLELFITAANEAIQKALYCHL